MKPCAGYRQIRQEVSRKGMAGNVKLGAGGIREVEFIAQIFQMIRGGQIRALQLKGTQETLLKLQELDILDSETAAGLLAAYRFLRDVEHRLQYWDDQQTQTLPDSPEQQQLLAESMGFADYAAFSDGLNAHREKVNTIFNEILSSPNEQAPALDGCWHCVWQETPTKKPASTSSPPTVLKPVPLPSASTSCTPATNTASSRAPPSRVLMPSCRFWCRPPPNKPAPPTPYCACSISRKHQPPLSYLALLHEHPQALEQLAALMSQSTWVAGYLMQHPILLDELLSAQLMQARNDWPKLAAELSDGLSNARGDTEAQWTCCAIFSTPKFSALPCRIWPACGQ